MSEKFEIYPRRNVYAKLCKTSTRRFVKRHINTWAWILIEIFRHCKNGRTVPTWPQNTSSGEDLVQTHSY